MVSKWHTSRRSILRGIGVVGAAGALSCTLPLARARAADDLVVGARLARVLCGGDRAAGDSLTEDDVLALERGQRLLRGRG